MQMDRREVVSAGAAAAAIAPFLASSPASAERPLGTSIVPKTKTFLSSNFYAPEVTIFDHRGCNRAPKEYKGGKTGDQDDEMLVRVKSVKVCDDAKIRPQIQQSLPPISRLDRQPHTSGDCHRMRFSRHHSPRIRVVRSR
jgi:hypothetical protein